MPVNVSEFRSWNEIPKLPQDIEIEGEWPEDLSGHIFIVAPFHRSDDCHLFAGEGVAIKWDLKPQNGKITLQAKKIDTWDGFWNLLPSFVSNLLPENFFPAKVGIIGIAEQANTAIVEMDGRLLMTADAGRYWEVDPVTLKTITPVGYFDEHIVSVPLGLFPLVVNSAHPFYDPYENELISCELKIRPRLEAWFKDMVSSVYLTRWDGQGTLKHWKLDGTVLDGSSHSVIVTKESIMIPDMSFQMGLANLLGVNISAQKAYPKTQIYLVNREDLKDSVETVPSRLITFPGDSFHFLWNYHPIDHQTHLVAIQQATISVSEAIKSDDVQHFTGEYYDAPEYFGIPWMLAFDPGVLRKVIIQADQVVSESAFIHPGWFSTTLYTADPREEFSPQGYSAIYQAYGGYQQKLICRRQYLRFRDHENRILTDKELPHHDLPSVLAKVPLDQDWDELTKQIETEKSQNPDVHISHLGKNLVDFYVFPDDYFLDSVQFIPQDQGYIFATVITDQDSQVWLFDVADLARGAIAKLNLTEEANFGFTLHSDYFAQVNPRNSDYKRKRSFSALRSLVKVPQEFFMSRSNDILNRKFVNQKDAR